jgi:hypothetical protein
MSFRAIVITLISCYRQVNDLSMYVKQIHLHIVMCRGSCATYGRVLDWKIGFIDVIHTARNYK